MNMRDKTASRRGALGKGISSLLGDPDGGEAESRTQSSPSSASSGTANRQHHMADVLRLPIDAVQPNPQQPRRIFNDVALKELSDSLRVDGVLQPIIVTRPPGEEKYTIIAGERRWRASKLAGLDSIPAIVKDTAADDLLRLALIENIQRADLNVLEEAEAYASLIKDYGLTQEQCADKVGKERSTVANLLRLLSLPREVQDDITEGRLTMGHGRALLSLEERKYILRARDIVIKKALNVRQTEQLVKSYRSNQKSGAAAETKDEADLNYVTDGLRNYLHTKVKLAGTASRGRIEISYFSAAELERVLKTMGYTF